MDAFDALPKLELHLHLEGAIPPEALGLLIRKSGGDAAARDPGALRERLRYRDFRHFLDLWNWKNGFLREAGDFTFIAEAVARDLVRQNVVYAEMFVSAPDFHAGFHPHPGAAIATQPLIEAVREGLARVPKIEVNLIGDLVRDYGPACGMRTLEELAEVRHLGVLGIGIGGSEDRFPPEPFAPVYERARALGFRTTAHAGEVAGASSIRGALTALGVDRIGHGTRAGEDPALLDRLASRRIALEMCPGSNVLTGAISSLEAHPIRRFFDRGLLVTVNTDDPGMFGNTLAGEYRALARVHGFTLADIRTLLRNAVEASWLAPEGKHTLLHRLGSAT